MKMYLGFTSTVFCCRIIVNFLMRYMYKFDARYHDLILCFGFFSFSLFLLSVCFSSTDGPLGPRGLAEATEMCTQECLVLGHSDNCWMPPSLGPYQQPKSPLSTFAPQKEWVKKDKLVNGHTLTRTWKEDSNRNQFSDRKQYGSSEGHFNTGNHMTDIPLANLKSYKQASGAVESPKEHQL